MSREFVENLLQAVARGELGVESAVEKLSTLNYESLDFARLDHQRPLRTGFPEAVWGSGKMPAQIAAIMERLSQRNACVMTTRVEPQAFSAIQELLPAVEYFAEARICVVYNQQFTQPQLKGRVGIISAGTADLPVAQEAAVTLSLCGAETIKLWDVGVAGLHRLLDNLPLIAQADVLVVVAGMEGALASVVGGFAAVPVIAVPTSVGYGAHFGGLAPLLAMLNSCATGVGVVNIDNGFGAAMLAAQILRVAERPALAAKDISEVRPDLEH